MKALFITPTVPWPANRGGNQRTNLLYRALAQIGTVDLFLIQRAPLEAEARDVLTQRFGLIAQDALPGRAELGVWSYLRPAAPKLIDRLAHNIGSHAATYRPVPRLHREIDRLIDRNAYDVVVGRYLLPIAAAGGLERLPSLVDIDDVDTQKYESRLHRPGVGAAERSILQWHVRRLNRVFPSVVAKADHLWLAAAADAAAVPHRSVSVLHNIPFSADGTLPQPFSEKRESRVVLCVATMNFPVNERAVDHFVTHVWPRVRAQEPTSTFMIVGSHMTEAQRARWTAYDGVIAKGYVEDLAAVYREAAFSVVPIFEGGGTKIKVLESLAYGRTCVVAEHSTRGHEHVLRGGESISIAADDNELVAECVRLLRDPDARARMAAHGAVVVAGSFSFDSFCRQVHQDVEKVLRESR